MTLTPEQSRAEHISELFTPIEIEADPAYAADVERSRLRAIEYNYQRFRKVLGPSCA